MDIPRIIPVLLLKGSGLYKTQKFAEPKYVGDPLNAVKIFNEKEVDELLVLDVLASREKRRPNFEMLYRLAGECFMPLAYGGGVSAEDDIRELIALGIEKVSINSAATDLGFIRRAAERFGSSTIAVSLDVKKNFWGKYEVHTQGGTVNTKLDPVKFAADLNAAGAGELILNSIDRDGMMQGYDLALIRAVSSAVDIPVIACGGAGTPEHLREAVRSGASAAAAGSMFVFHGKHRAVLISYPDQQQLQTLFSS